jgi:hypothetical protein
MQNGPKTMRPRERKALPPSGVRSKSITARPAHMSSQSAQRNHEHYLALARVEAQAGNPVGAENYYQHAEHYFRLMSSISEKATGRPRSEIRVNDDQA